MSPPQTGQWVGSTELAVPIHDEVLGRAPLTRRHILGAVSVGGGTAALAACVPAQSPRADTTPAQPAKVSFTTEFSSGERAQWVQQTVARFNELNSPRITVE